MQEIEWRVRHRNLHGVVLCVPLPLTLCGNFRCVTAQRDETRLFTTRPSLGEFWGWDGDDAWPCAASQRGSKG